MCSPYHAATAGPRSRKAHPIREDAAPAWVLDLIDLAAEAGMPGVADKVVEASRILTASIGPGPVAEAIRSGSSSVILDQEDAWVAFEAKLSEIFAPDGPLSATMRTAISGAIQGAPVPMVIDTGVIAERSGAWLSRHGGQRITGLSANTRAGITRLVQDAFAAPQGVKDAARAILRSDGFALTERQAVSFERFVERLTAPGTGTPAGIQQAIDRRYTKMLRQRADLVAQTEAYTAGNAGQIETWRTGTATGQIDGSLYVIEWVTRVIDVCPRCQALDGTTASIDGGIFTSREVESGPWSGQVLEVSAPTVHPRCYCTTHLIRADQAQDYQQAAS